MSSNLRELALFILFSIEVGALAGCGDQKPSASPAAVAKAESPIPYAFILGSESDSDRKMLIAAGSGDLSQIEQAIADGGNIEAKDMIRRTPMFAAAFRNQPDVIRMLAGKGARVMPVDAVGQTPLHAAVAVGATAAVQALLDAGADVNARDEGGRTALQIAMATGRVDMAQLLRNRGGKVGDKQETKHRRSTSAPGDR